MKKMPQKTKADALRWSDQRFNTIVDRLVKDAKGVKDPKLLASTMFQEIIAGFSRNSRAGVDAMEVIFQEARVERSRLPKNATIGDFCLEAIFINHLGHHERRLNLPDGALSKSIRQEQIPSWIIWSETLKATRNLVQIDGSTVGDLSMVPFGLYLSGMEVDKRILNSVKEASRKHGLLKLLHQKLFRKSSMANLVQQLRNRVD